MRNCVFAAPGTVPETTIVGDAPGVTMTDDSVGVLRPSFAPLVRLMLAPVLAKIRLLRMLLLFAGAGGLGTVITATPSPLVLAMILPLAASKPPMVLVLARSEER